MRKAHGKKRIVSFLTALMMVFSMFSTSLLSVSAAGILEMSNISISGNTGYYIKDGDLYSYDVQTEKSTAVGSMTDLDADYVLYDGTNLYMAGTNTVVTAYNTENWSQKWKFDKQDAFKFQPPMSGAVYCQPNAEMVLKDGCLYIYTYAIGGSFMQQAKAAVVILNAENGTEKNPVSLTNVSNSNGNTKSLAYELDDNLVFSGSTFATVNTKTSEVTYKAGLFDGAAVYESAMNAVVGLSDGTVQYTAYPLTDFAEKTNMNLTPAGSNPVMMNVDKVPVIFSVKDSKVVYDIFTGLELVTKTTDVKAESLFGLSISGNNAYILNQDGEIAKIAVNFEDTPIHQAPTENAKKLDQRIQAILDEMGNFNGEPWIDKSLSLEYEEEINSIDKAYNAMDESERKGVLKAKWLNKLKAKSNELRQNLDKLNDIIKALPSVENLKKSDAEEVKAAQNTYNGMHEFDKTLVDKKLSVLLEKVAAFDVIDLIDALPTVEEVKTTDLSTVQAVRKAFDAVVDKWKGEVSNLTKLEEIEKKLDELLQGMGEGSYWSSYGKDHNNNAVVDSKLPTSLDDMEILFDGQKEKVSANEPIVVGDRVYTAQGKKLSCFDLNGNLITTVDTYTSSDFFSRFAYGDGKIFVTIKGRVQAFDANTLKSLWLTPDTGLQMQSPITYNDGYIYFGGTNGGGGGSAPTDGAYYCVSTKDEDPKNPYEVKDVTWESKTGGYYWGGGIVVGDKIYFAGDNGTLYVRHLTEDIVYDSYVLGGKVRSVPVYDPATNRLMVATVDNHTLYAFELNQDGSLNKESIIKTDEFGGTLGGFSSYNGRVYLPSGGMLASGPLVVMELDEKVGKFTKAYEISHIKSQSLPLVTTAYATAKNDYTVYVYAVDYESGIAYCFEDRQGQTEYKEAFKIGNTEIIGGKEHKTTTYNSAGFRADQNGNLYFVGGSSWGFPSGGSATTYALTIFGSKNADFTADDVENAIALLPDEISYVDKENVMAVKARYDALTDQSNVFNADKLNGAVNEIERLTHERLGDVEEEIAKISNPVVLSDEKTIETASQLYGALLEDDKALVSGRDKLKNAIAALYDLKSSVEGLIEKIEQLPGRDEITLEHTALVNEIWNAYEALSDSDKEKITNRQKLLDAKDKLKELNDKLLVEELIDQINALPTSEKVTLADETKVKNLYNDYEGLHEAAKVLVTNAQKLKELYEKISAYRKAVDEIDNLIWNELDPLNITLKDKETVESIAEKYSALRPEEQEYVKYYSDVEDAQEIIAALEKGIVPKKVFENIAGMDLNYTVQGNGYTIIFNGMNISNPTDFNYGISMNPVGKADFEKLLKNGMVFGFDETKNFPGKATVSLEVSLKDGTYVIYQYDIAENAAVKMQVVEVKDGKATFEVEKGGVYAIAEGLTTGEDGKENQDNDFNTDVPKTGDMGIPIVSMLLLVTSLIGLSALIANKRKKSI